MPTIFESTKELILSTIEKAKKAAPVGTEKIWGGKVYVKTPNGWIPKGKLKGPKEEEQSSQRTPAKQDISSFAAKASDNQLQAALKDEEAPSTVKAAAKEELSKRQGKSVESSSKENKIDEKDSRQNKQQETPNKEQNNKGLKEALQRILDASDEFDDEFLAKVKEKLDSLSKPKEESKGIDEVTLDKKLDNLKNEIVSSLDKKIDELKGKEAQKQIKKTGLMIEGKKVHITLEGDAYVAKGIGETFKSKPGQDLSSFKEEVKEHYKPIAQKWNEKKVDSKAQEIPVVNKGKETKETNSKETKLPEIKINPEDSWFIQSIQLKKSLPEKGKTDMNISFAGKNYKVTIEMPSLKNTIVDPVSGDTYEAAPNELSIMKKVQYINGMQANSNNKFISSAQLQGFQSIQNKEDSILDKSLRESLVKSVDELEIQPEEFMEKQIKKHLNEFMEKQVKKYLDEGDFAPILDTYANYDGKIKERLAINKILVDNGYLPIANGALLSNYNGHKYKNLAGSEARKYYEDGEYKVSVTEDQAFALNMYIGPDYKDFRDFNYGEFSGESYSEKEMGEFSKQIDSYITENPIDDYVILNRRMNFSSERANEFKPYLTAKPGDTIIGKSFDSYSLEQLDFFGSDLQITLLAKPGDPVANIRNSTESEFLAARNLTYKVIARGTNSIALEIIN